MTTDALLSGNGDDSRCLVVVFLRGAADGLNMVVPVEDDDYHLNRPNIGLSKSEVLPLGDGFFGLNPALKDFLKPYNDGHLAIVHAAGTEDDSRSHFESQDFMEHGGIAAGGWVGRYLRFGRAASSASALAAVSLGTTLPESLSGAPAATVLESLDQFSLGANSGGLTLQLGRLYGAQMGQLATAGKDALSAMARIEILKRTPYKPEFGVVYPNEPFAQKLQQIAQLLKARLGLQAATLDIGGWDSHFTQAPIINPLMTQLSEGLAAFYRDLGSLIDTTSVVVMTEFGRRVAENSSFGTDHGRGSAMFLMGGGVRGGRVIGDWPGLKSTILEGPGDLPVKYNYRDVLAPVLTRLGAGDFLQTIFPGHQFKPLDT
jgi:uncharacterized protein (DUF1501 family)